MYKLIFMYFFYTVLIFIKLFFIIRLHFVIRKTIKIELDKISCYPEHYLHFIWQSSKNYKLRWFLGWVPKIFDLAKDTGPHADFAFVFARGQFKRCRLLGTFPQLFSAHALDGNSSTPSIWLLCALFMFSNREQLRSWTDVLSQWKRNRYSRNKRILATNLFESNGQTQISAKGRRIN